MAMARKHASFCYVDDLVEGIYRLLLSDYSKPVNIGTLLKLLCYSLQKKYWRSPVPNLKLYMSHCRRMILNNASQI